MERRAVLALPWPSPDNCRWCGYPLIRGEHGIMGPSDIEGRVGVKCKVPFDVTQETMPRMDVLVGTGTFRKVDG